MYDKAVTSYNRCPTQFTQSQRKKAQQNKLNLETTIQSYLSHAYKSGDPKITHFYDNVGYAGVPLWALFEIMMLGDFGFLLSCLCYDVRDQISHAIGLNLATDTDRQLVYKYVYALKDLRNAIAHNAVIFDTRFRTIDPSKAMKQCLAQEIGLPYVDFKTIGDYVILISYYLKLLGVTKTEIKAFVRDFEKITYDYKNAVNPNVSAKVIRQDLFSRMSILKTFI